MKPYMSIAVSALMIAISSQAMAKVKIVASFSILGDMVTQIAGDDAEVTTIVGPDADAHLYMPNASDAVSVTQADMIFINGLGFETWIADLIENSGTKAEVITATEAVTPLMVEGQIDPHAWNSLSNGLLYIEAITKALVRYDAKNKEGYLARSAAYKDRLQALDKYAKDALARLGQEEQVVVTAHDAFGYLADAYGMQFLAPVGIDTDAEPSARELAALIDYLQSVKAKALFVENITNDSLIAQIASETGIEIGGRLYSDALSVRGGPATSYLAMYEHNLEALITALSR
ncbi:MAG: metal ABC transporter solute-binding protein, Zn/Mn family [Candidatus Puniceispirillaceae bacterium]